MNIAGLEVFKGLVANNSTDKPQLIQVSVATTDIRLNTAELKWYNVHADGTIDEPFASATLFYGDPSEWLASWVPATHLVQGRIEDLERLAESGIANRFTNNMAYLLFAKSLVDYASKYRGMQSVVLHGLEAFADVELSTEKGGSWTVPPYFIDSVAHLAGFIMNVSDAMDTNRNFCVTPGWQSMRFAKPLTAGKKYRSYVKMIPTVADPSVYLGDVYILQDNQIIGLVGGIQFRQYPRILLSRFFSAPDDFKAPPIATKTPSKPNVGTSVTPPAGPQPAATLVPSRSHATAPTTAPVTAPATAVATAPATAVTLAPAPAPEQAVEGVQGSGTTAAKAMQIIATEAALDLAELTDDASVAGLGVDSLMSLVIAEKFREQLGVVVTGSLFLDFATIRDLRVWLEEYYD